MAPQRQRNKHGGSIDKDKQSRHCALAVRISLIVNIIILVPVCTTLTAFGSSELAIDGWGPPTAARGILLSIYLSILVVSIALLTLYTQSSGSSRTASEFMVAALLSTQIIYKITTPFTAGADNPVAIANLCVSALHARTLYLLYACTLKTHFLSLSR